MSAKGKLQVQRDAEIRLTKLEDEMGPTEKETIKIILHDFNPDSEWSGNPPPIMTNPRTGDRVEVILVPYKQEENE